MVVDFLDIGGIIYYRCLNFLFIKYIFLALDAMRKAYEEDLEEEKQKYRDALKSMFTDDFVEEIRRRHE